jgi:hypothetical protein
MRRGFRDDVRWSWSLYGVVPHHAVVGVGATDGKTATKLPLFAISDHPGEARRRFDVGHSAHTISSRVNPRQHEFSSMREGWSALWHWAACRWAGRCG